MPPRNEHPRMAAATRTALALRLTISYLIGPLLLTIVFRDFVFIVAGVVVSWPLYLVALVAVVVFTQSVLLHVALWTVTAVLIASLFSLHFLPFDGHLWSLGTIGALSAALSGVAFYLWSVLRPLSPAKPSY